MTAGISNSAVADLLERHGRLLEIAGESPFRTRAFTRAAESLRLYPERVAEVAAEGRLRDAALLCGSREGATIDQGEKIFEPRRVHRSSASRKRPLLPAVPAG